MFAILNLLNSDISAIIPTSSQLPYLVKFSMAVFLSLWDVKNLVHVWIPLLPCYS